MIVAREPVSIYTVRSRRLRRAVYVGQTGKTETRWARHCSQFGRSPSAGGLAEAIRKEGVARFEFNVVDTAPNRAIANNIEKRLIAHSRTLAPRGFNLTTGGGWDFSLTESFREQKSRDGKEIWARPGFREAASQRAREIWERPEFRAERILGLQKR
jgi:hypothetical protein